MTMEDGSLSPRPPPLEDHGVLGLGDHGDRDWPPYGEGEPREPRV